jgi:hypothetical protein
MKQLVNGTMTSWSSSDVSAKFKNFLNSLVQVVENDVILPNEPFYRLFSKDVWNEFGAAVSRMFGQVNMNFGDMGKMIFDLVGKVFPPAAELLKPQFNTYFGSLASQLLKGMNLPFGLSGLVGGMM